VITVKKADVIRIVPDLGPERIMIVAHVEHHVITMADHPDPPAESEFPATWEGGHALVIEFGDMEIIGRCQCGVPLGTITPAESLEVFAQPWETHAMTAGR
jgi:hypothetical protein